MRQGKAYIPIDSSFQKSELKKKRHIDQNELNILYRKIRSEANELLT